MIRHEVYTKGRFLIQDEGVFYTKLPFLIKRRCSEGLLAKEFLLLAGRTSHYSLSTSRSALYKIVMSALLM
jgi:hypothetical protein